MRVSVAVLAVCIVLFTYVCAQEKVAPETSLKSRYAYLRRWVQNAMLNGMKTASRQSWKNRKGCYEDDEKMLPQRLLDWFHILKSEELKKNGQQVKTEIKNSRCNSPVLTWFFQEFDTNKDLLLDQNERAEIEMNPDEHCMRKFFSKCDLNKDDKISLNEICACFLHVEPPCTLELKKSRAKGHMLGRYEPGCDEDGYYKPRQCHENYCWCVDRFNQMIEGSKKESWLVTCRDNTNANDVLFAGDYEAAELDTL